MERSKAGPSCGSRALLGLPVPIGQLVVWSATAGSRSLDQLASGLGHGLSTDSGRLHCHGLDHNDGVSDVNGRECLASFLMFFKSRGNLFQVFLDEPLLPSLDSFLLVLLP